MAIGRAANVTISTADAKRGKGWKMQRKSHIACAAVSLMAVVGCALSPAKVAAGPASRRGQRGP